MAPITADGNNHLLAFTYDAAVTPTTMARMLTLGMRKASSNPLRTSTMPTKATAAANRSSPGGRTGSAGCTTPYYSYKYQQSGEVNGNSATLTAINVSVTVSLPNWLEYKDASRSEQKAWDAIIAKLRAHEEGHVAIARAGVTTIKSAIQGTTAKGSGETPRQALTRAKANLKASVKSRFKAAVNTVHERQ